MSTMRECRTRVTHTPCCPLVVPCNEQPRPNEDPMNVATLRTITGVMRRERRRKDETCKEKQSNPGSNPTKLNDNNASLTWIMDRKVGWLEAFLGAAAFLEAVVGAIVMVVWLV